MLIIDHSKTLIRWNIQAIIPNPRPIENRCLLLIEIIIRIIQARIVIKDIVPKIAVITPLEYSFF